jgi:hypothetical protein
MHESEIRPLAKLPTADCRVPLCDLVPNTIHQIEQSLRSLGRAAVGDSAFFGPGLRLCRFLLNKKPRRHNRKCAGAELEDAGWAILTEVRNKLGALLAPVASTDGPKADVEAACDLLILRGRELAAERTCSAPWDDFETVALSRHCSGTLHGRVAVEFSVPGGAKSLRLPAAMPEVIQRVVSGVHGAIPSAGRIQVDLRGGHGEVQLEVRAEGGALTDATVNGIGGHWELLRTVADVRTHGPVMDLSQAYLVIRRYNGRFWVGTDMAKASCVRLWIPSGGSIMTPPCSSGSESAASGDRRGHAPQKDRLSVAELTRSGRSG